MAVGTMVSIDFRTDDTQTVACNWRKANVYPKIAEGGVVADPPNVLTGDGATPDALIDALNNPSVVYVTGVGHGAADAFPGPPSDPALSTTTYDPPLVSGKIIHLVSCNTAALLGKALAAPGGGGAVAFFGYNGLFSWPENVSSEVLDIFFGCDAQIDFALAGGKTAGEAYHMAIRAYQSAHEKLLADYPGAGAQLAAMLAANLSYLCGPQVGAGPYGFADAKLGPPLPGAG